MSPPARPRSPAATPRVRPEAFEAYLRGRQVLGRRSPRAATPRRWSSSSRPWPSIPVRPRLGTGFGVRLVAGVLPGRVGRRQPGPRAGCAHKALAIDPREGSAYGALGGVELYFDWDFERARGDVERAVALSPHEMLTRHSYADYLMVTGRFAESLDQVRRGRDANPSSPMAQFIVLFHTVATRRPDAVRQEARLFLDRFSQGAATVHFTLGDLLWRGEHEEALAEYELAMGAEGFRAFAGAFRRGGPRAALVAYAELLSKRAQEAGRPPDWLVVAGRYAEAGEADKAFALLDEAYEARTPSCSTSSPTRRSTGSGATRATTPCCAGSASRWRAPRPPADSSRPAGYVRRQDDARAVASGSASGAQNPSARRRRQPSACSNRPDHSPTSRISLAHRLQVRREALALVEPLLLGPMAGQHRRLLLEHHAAHVHEVRRPHHGAEGVAVAVGLRVVDGDRPVHRRGRGVGRHVPHPAAEGGRDREAAGVLVVLHVVARRVRQQDVRRDAANDGGDLRQGEAFVEHLDVVHQALVPGEPHEAAGLLRFGAAHPRGFLPPVDARSAAPVRDGEAVDLVSGALQPQQGARGHELHVVGVREDGEGDGHGTGTGDTRSRFNSNAARGASGLRAGRARG